MGLQFQSSAGLSAFLFTDIEGSSLRWLNHRVAMQRAVARHDEIIRGTVAAHGGEIFKAAGDAFYAAFARPSDAVNAAVAAQRALGSEDWADVDGLKVRMAVHFGSAEQRGSDFFGPALNRTARLLDLAHGGQVLATASMAELLVAEREVQATFEQVGTNALDDPAQPVGVFQVIAPGLARSFPPLREPKKSRPADAPVTMTKSTPSRPLLVMVGVGLAILAAGLVMMFVNGRKPPTSAVGAPGDKSVAVLAFSNLSEDKANEYFSDGISEELLNVLSKVPGLKVSARTSAFHFKGKDTPIGEIARQLGVAYVVEGSVRKSGNRVRITAQLINAADGFHVWSDNFDREVKDIFVVQDEIAGLIAKNLKLKLAVAPSQPAVAEVNPEAYRLYLEGRQQWAMRTNDALKQAAKLFQQALDLDPQFARAYVGLADTESVSSRDPGVNNTTRLKNLQLVDRALELDPNLSEAHASRGIILDALRRWDEAKPAFERALALNPNYASAHQWYGRLLWALGDLGRAEEELRRAEELDPIAPIMPGNYGLYLNSLRRYREGLAAGDRALALQPGFAQGKLVRAQALLGLKRYPEAAALYREIIASPDTGGAFRRPAYLAAQLAFAGDPGPAQAVLAELQAASTRESVQTANLLMSLGRSDEALTELARPGEKQQEFADVLDSPAWDSVRDDPRFLAAIAREGLTEVYHATWREIQKNQAREAGKK